MHLHSSDKFISRNKVNLTSADRSLSRKNGKKLLPSIPKYRFSLLYKMQVIPEGLKTTYIWNQRR
jgi:hypothetical protein